MSDLRSEIVSKVLNSWENQPAPVQTNEQSISHKVFEFIENNPSCTINDVVKGTGVELGRASATTLALYQRGKLDRKLYPNPDPNGKRDNVFVYWTAVDNYTDIGTNRKPKKEKKAKKVKEPTLVMPRIKQFVEEIRDLEVTNKQFIAEDFIEKLSVTQAKAVYLALKNIFDSRLHG